MTEFNNYHPNIKFNYESNKENTTFLDLEVKKVKNRGSRQEGTQVIWFRRK